LTLKGELLRRWVRRADRLPFDEDGLLSAKLPTDLSPPVGEGADCMEAVIHSEVFGDFFRKLAALKGIVRVVADGAGWHAEGAAHEMQSVMAVLKVQLPRANMVEYRPLPKPVEFGIDAPAAATKRFREAARCRLSSRGGRLELEAGRLRWELRNWEKELVPVFADTLRLEKRRWPVSFQVDGDEMARGLRALTTEHVRLVWLQADNEGGGRFLMSSEDDETNCEPEVSFTARTLGVCRSAFLADYLGHFFKVLRGDRLVVHLGANEPLRVDWSGPYTRGTWFLAPASTSEA
jgi:hypothetical protein